MNKVLLTGRITKDPEIRYTQSGIPSLLFTLAVDRGMRDSSGNRQADFINCVAWRNQADFMSRYIKKGYMLAVEGRIQTRNYHGQDGQMHYVTEVGVDQVENLQPRDPSSQPMMQNNTYQPNTNYTNPSYQNYGGAAYNTNQPQSTNQPSSSPTPQSFNVDVADDDLPF